MEIFQAEPNTTYKAQPMHTFKAENIEKTVAIKFVQRPTRKSGDHFLCLKQINLLNDEVERNLKTFYIHPVAKSYVARSKTAAVSFLDPSISRTHGQIRFSNGKYYYVSTASAGSYRKLRKDEEVKLVLGSTLEIGDNEFEVVSMQNKCLIL
jgi:hypothetical protein